MERRRPAQLGARQPGLNQITGQVNHLYRLSDVTSAITGEHYTRDFPNVDIFPPRLSFPTVNTGAGGGGGSHHGYASSSRFKDDVSLLNGNHALKFGANFNYLPDIGIMNGNEHFATLTFFDDPSVILSNSNGRYPQGFQTPGIVRTWQQANPVLRGLAPRRTAVHDVVPGRLARDAAPDAEPGHPLRRRFQLLRSAALREQRDAAGARRRSAIRHGAMPKTPIKDISPRVGFAYDLSGDGRRVLRGGYGLYFDQFNINGGNVSDITSQNRRPLNVLATLTNTAIGVGQLATYRFGIDPLPAQPTEANTLPLGATGQWTRRLHGSAQPPGAHRLCPRAGDQHQLSVDYTHIMGRNEFRTLNINPIVNGTRVLAPDVRGGSSAAPTTSTP